MLCLGAILGTTACGMRNDTDNNATDRTPNEQNNTNNDVTEGTDRKDQDGGVIDDIGNTTGNVIDDIGNGIKDMTDGNNNTNNNNR